MSLDMRHTKTRVYNDRWGMHGHEGMRQPMLKEEEQFILLPMPRLKLRLANIQRKFYVFLL